MNISYASLYFTDLHIDWLTWLLIASGTVIITAFWLGYWLVWTVWCWIWTALGLWVVSWQGFFRVIIWVCWIVVIVIVIVCGDSIGANCCWRGFICIWCFSFICLKCKKLSHKWKKTFIERNEEEPRLAFSHFNFEALFFIWVQKLENRFSCVWGIIRLFELQCRKTDLF